MSIRYDRAQKCSTGPQPGATALLAEIRKQFPGSASAGIYNCRNVRGGSSLSLHAEGRALDVKPSSKSQGDLIRNWVYARREQLQAQEIIWYRQIWSSIYPDDGFRPYNGTNPHTDHVHVGLNWIGAANPTSGGVTAGSTGTDWIGGLLVASLVGATAYFLLKGGLR